MNTRYKYAMYIYIFENQNTVAIWMRAEKQVIAAVLASMK